MPGTVPYSLTSLYFLRWLVYLQIAVAKLMYKNYVSCLQNGTDAREEEHYQLLMKTVRWFFFELLIFGYVEDPATGLSFQYPAGLSWALYNEVHIA